MTEATPPVEKKTDYIKRAIGASIVLCLVIGGVILIKGFTSSPRTQTRAEAPAGPPANNAATADSYRKKLEAYRRSETAPDDSTTVQQARDSDQPRISDDERRAAEYVRNQLLQPMLVRNAGDPDAAAAQPAPSAAPQAPNLPPDDAARYADLQRRIQALRQAQQSARTP